MRNITMRFWDKEKKEMHIMDFWSAAGYMAAARLSMGEDLRRYEPMRSTGLEDMDGKEVFEDDYIDFGGLKPLKIVWRDGGFEAPLLPYDKSNPIKLTPDGFSHFAKVIGNVYENPEIES